MSEFTDTLGRQLETGNLTLKEIKDLISSLTVGKATIVNKEKEEADACDGRA